MFSTTDTIVAIATPPGRGGIGVVRLSGPAALSIAQRLVTDERPLEPRRATFTRVRDGADRNGSTSIDHAVATYFPAPRSYTGDDVVELSLHGSPVVLRAVVAAAIECGARLAEPGEFTLRAFLNGRIDLMQAEAVADLVEAVTPLQARAAFDQLEGTLTQQIAAIDREVFELAARLEASIDFPDEGYHFVEPGAAAASLDGPITRIAALLDGARRGRLIREGLQVAIVGEPNVGKSSLFNALAGASRAIVTDVPGTTRDLVTEVVDLDGLRVTLVDTAGLRDSDDPIESQGVSRAMQAQQVADLVLVVLDASRPRPAAVALSRSAPQCKVLYVANKSDLPEAWRDNGAIAVSALTGDGLDLLRREIVRALDAERLRDVPAVTNVRHIALVQRAHDALVRARQAAAADGGALPEEFVLADLQQARAALEEISGRRAPEDLLAEIFSRFCVGK